MKRFIVSLSGGLYAFLAAWSVASAAEVPDSSASSAPALAAYDDRLVMAWAGESGTEAHHVLYTLFDGYTFTPQADIPGALTITAPALAAVGKVLTVATTPPNSGNQIHLYTSSGAGFEMPGTALCDAESCARTLAAPALVADGGTLFAAWTTPEGAIMTASRSSAGWIIDPTPIPNAVTSPTTGPTLTFFQHRLAPAASRLGRALRRGSRGVDRDADAVGLRACGAEHRLVDADRDCGADQGGPVARRVHRRRLDSRGGQRTRRRAFLGIDQPGLEHRICALESAHRAVGAVRFAGAARTRVIDGSGAGARKLYFPDAQQRVQAR
jgi:hypothetical protein